MGENRAGGVAAKGPRDPLLTDAPRSYHTYLHRDLAFAVLLELQHQGMTQKELAIRCGLTEKHVSRVLRGRDEGGFGTWQAFARHLGKTWEVGLL